MQSNAIFWPVFVQVVLSLAMYLVMSARRIAAVKAGQAKPRDFAIPRDPEMSATAARNVSNQFELPVLFTWPAWLSIRSTLSILLPWSLHGSSLLRVLRMPGFM